MAFAVFKLSYNIAGQTPVTGGVCASGFFVSGDTALTAYHVINRDVIHTPNHGFKNCRYWILTSDGTAIRLLPNLLHEFPEIDLTVLKFSHKVSGREYSISREIPHVAEEVISYGYSGNKGMPSVNAEWVDGGLIIHEFDLRSVTANQRGYIRRILSMQINALDVKLNGVQGIETSFGGVEGMSGGPLVSRETSKVIGLMSFGLPAAENVKDQLYAVSIEEIGKRMAQIGT